MTNCVRRGWVTALDKTGALRADYIDEGTMFRLPPGIFDIVPLHVPGFVQRASINV